MRRIKTKNLISIKSKLIRMQLFLAGITLLAASLSFLFNDILIFKKSVERNLESTAKILALNLITTLEFSDSNEATKVLSSVKSDPSIVGAILFDKSGNIFSTYGITADSVKSSYKGFVIQGSHVTFRYDIGKDQESLGQLYLDADLKILAADYKVYIVSFSLVFLAALFMSFVLSQILQKYFSEPIVEFAKTAKKITKSGDYSLRITGDSLNTELEELHSLSSEFNQMLDQIEEQDRKIRLEKDAAEKANQAKSVFLANISHELRTPMHGILSFARFGQQKIGTGTKEKLKSYFDEIHDSGARLMTLLNDLLDLSKLEAGKISYSMQEANILEVANSVCSEMRAYAAEKTLTLNLVTGTNPIVGIFDAERIMQVLRNIVSNAIKFSNKGTSIKINIDNEKDSIVCSVANYGMGIPENELTMIFDKFVQSSKTRTNAGGTGLGLAICKEIIEQHGGTIWAESGPNGETRFKFKIPCLPIKEQTSAA